MEDCKVLTCLTCRVVFADIDKGREHYKSEWHRYNLKRKVAQMAPLSAEVYKNQVAASKQEVRYASRLLIMKQECFFFFFYIFPFSLCTKVWMNQVAATIVSSITKVTFSLCLKNRRQH